MLLNEYIRFVYYTGVRPGTETDNLKWKNIRDFKDKKDGRIYISVVVNGKTGKRILVCDHQIRPCLECLRDRFEHLKGKPFNDLSDCDEYVFILPNGEKPKDLHGCFELLLKDCNLLKDKHDEDRTLYSLRHTYATMNLLKGVDIHLLSRQMGTSVAMIESHYSHIQPIMNANILAGKPITTGITPDTPASIMEFDFNKISNDLTGTDEYTLPTADLTDSDSVQDIFNKLTKPD